MMLIALCAVSPAHGDILDINVFKPLVDSDEFFEHKDSDEKRRRERRRDDDDKDVDYRDVDDKDDGDKHAELKKNWTSDFQDTDFSKNSFRDFKDDPGRSVFDEKSGDPSREAKGGDRDSRRDKVRDSEHSLIGAASAGAFSTYDDDWRRLHDIRKRELRDEERMKLLTRPIPNMLHDWVPSKVDRRQNGGFTIAADNGYPVPYTLNGWVEIERDFPWGGSP